MKLWEESKKTGNSEMKEGRKREVGRGIVPRTAILQERGGGKRGGKERNGKEY